MNLTNLVDTPMKRDAYRKMQQEAVQKYFKFVAPLKKEEPVAMFNRWAKEELEALGLDKTPDGWLIAGDMVCRIVENILAAEQEEDY